MKKLLTAVLSAALVAIPMTLVSAPAQAKTQQVKKDKKAKKAKRAKAVQQTAS